MQMMKTLYDISWRVSESTYRADPALSYSTLAKYEREGFNNINRLFDKIETPSLVFGSAVDSIITGGQEEFDKGFMVADFPSTPDSIVRIVKDIFSEYNTTYKTLDSIPDIEIIHKANSFNYQPNWKPETRAKVIKEKGSSYYNLMYVAGDRTILDTNTYQDVCNVVKALKESSSTKYYFDTDDPFDDSIKRYYQLKFKATLHGIDYRCMADLIMVDYKNKIVYPIDLKTSHKPEYDFYKSFIEWSYQIQARLYWRIIRANLDSDEYFKDFKLDDYRFIVVSRDFHPLVWRFHNTTAIGELTYGRLGNIILRDPEIIGKELRYILDNKPTYPSGIKPEKDNDIVAWIQNNM